MKKRNMTNSNLNKARNARNDEFYTKYEDIEKEVDHYKDQLKNKVVYCPCDDPEKSNFWKYFYNNFSELGLKELIATYYVEIGNSYCSRYNGQSVVQKDLQFNGDFQ